MFAISRWFSNAIGRFALWKWRREFGPVIVPPAEVIAALRRRA